MKLLVATDIFGETVELVDWLTPVAQASGGGLELVSPYTERLAHNEIASATSPTDELVYQRFLAQGGINAYVEKLQHCFKRQQEPYIAIGFSAGAAALWQLAASSQPALQQVFAFYGGQIRHCPDLQPLVSTTLIWAQEHFFDVGQLHQKLTQYARVSSVLTPYQHGFINPYSAGFNSHAALDYQQWLIANVNSGVRVNC